MMDIVDRIVEFIADTAVAEYMDSGEALDLLQDAKLELRNRPYMGRTSACELKQMNDAQFQTIGDLQHEVLKLTSRSKLQARANESLREQNQRQFDRLQNVDIDEVDVELLTEMVTSLQKREVNQSQEIRDLKLTIDLLPTDLINVRTDRVDMLHDECVAKEQKIANLHDELEELGTELEEAKAETIRALDVATNINNEVSAEAADWKKKVDDLWADVIDAENRAGIYHGLLMDMAERKY